MIGSSIPRVLLASATMLCCALCCGTVLGEPQEMFRPGEIWPDDQGVHINAHGGGVLVDKDVYYWFGQHMVAGKAGNSAQVGVHVYSSRDLYHWKDEGIALRVSEDPQSDIVKGCVLERPKVIYNALSGKFVMWFHLELKGQGYLAARSGVAISDRVTGPYRFLGSFRPNAGVWPLDVPEDLRQPLSPTEQAALETRKLPGGAVPDFPQDQIYRRDYAGGQMARDMTLFVDDDQKAYHLYASEENSCLQISQLTDDYLAPAGKYLRTFPGRFHEAPAMFKHEGKYYLITSGCTGWAPNAARSAVADSIWGPWRELGNPCVGPEDETKITFDSQSTFVLPVAGKPGALIFMADRWRPNNAIDGRHIWLPLRIADGKPRIEWLDQWDLSVFDK